MIVSRETFLFLISHRLLILMAHYIIKYIMEKIAIANQKGGVGKTTTAINLAHALADAGKKVLLVDIDPQLNATSGLGVEEREDSNIYHFLIGEKSFQEVSLMFEHNLYLIPGTRDLAGLQVEISYINEWQTLLKRRLVGIDKFDFIIFDTPPSIGPFTIISLVASDSVIIPVQCEYYALEGLSQLVRTIKMVKDSYNPSLKIKGLLLTMYDRRVNLSKQVEEEVRRYFGRKVFRSVIPRSVRLAEAPSFGMTIFKYAPHSSGSESYRELAREILNG